MLTGCLCHRLQLATNVDRGRGAKQTPQMAAFISLEQAEAKSEYHCNPNAEFIFT
ncbi:hypothetical protein ES319_D06G039800v1 [Gossypium barbadense]|uniref:Uncharacterized protein n=1 Tax=Gossypium barbadense TaxID=3634 RepID=A0A5J5R4H8_GOSBA|nr:hypothetical protein ES319_D06G039800v1 [Gossypium barbadense]